MGDAIVQEVATGTSFYLLVAGEVAVKTANHKIVRLEAGLCFGEMGMISRRPRTASIVAATPVTVMKLRDRWSTAPRSTVSCSFNGSLSSRSMAANVQHAGSISLAGTLDLLHRESVLTATQCARVRTSLNPDDDRHPFVQLADLGLQSSSKSRRPLVIESITWLVAEACGLPYFRLDPPEGGPRGGHVAGIASLRNPFSILAANRQ